MNDVRHVNNEDESLRLVWDDMGNTDLDVIPSSPLAVNTDHMCVITLPSLEFHDFDALPVKTTLYNNGRTVTMNGIWSSDKRPSISGSSLIDRYCFSHLHFHWTENNNLGSEHTINGKCHAMEMHLIFFKRSCKTIFEAESQQNGYVTLAYVFNITPNEQHHFGIDCITLNLKKIQAYRKSVEIPAIPLSRLVGNQPGEYFTYLGKAIKLNGDFGISQWIVFTEALDVSSEQLREFRCVTNERGRLIRSNCRAASVAAANHAPYLVPSTRGPDVAAAGHTPYQVPATRDPVGGGTWPEARAAVPFRGSSSSCRFKINKAHVLRREFVKNRITHTRNGAVVTVPAVEPISSSHVIENHEEWMFNKPPWK